MYTPSLRYAALRHTLLCCVALLLSVAAQATTYYVNSQGSDFFNNGSAGSPFKTIQKAVNTAAAGDTISVSPGTFREKITWNDKDLTIQGAGAGISVIDARVFSGQTVNCMTTAHLTPASKLDGFTLQNGNPSGYGGGLYNFSSSPTITNCAFTGNHAGAGGGIFNNQSNPTITNCYFGGNTAVQGGGIGNSSSSPTITNCTFAGNTAPGKFGDGGGMYNYAGNPVITNCTFTGNTASGTDFHGNGGGMYNDSSSPTLTNCTFIGNIAIVTTQFGKGNGGGVYNFSSNATLINCAFTGNTANSAAVSIVRDTGLGGGLCNLSSNATLVNCTAAGNSARTGGGFYNTGGGLTLSNCLVWGNNNGISNGSGSTVITYSDVQDYGLTASPDANGNFAADPLFVDSANGDFRLLSSSPCIDTGNDGSLPADDTTDLAGKPRISGAHVDVGAYEYPKPHANAGPDQVLRANHSGDPDNEVAVVTLDGSASFDPDGDPLTYAWDDGQGHTANGATPTLSLPVGIYTFTLTVSNPSGDSNADTVLIQVRPALNQPPTLKDQSITAKQDRAVTFTLDATDPDNDTFRGALIGFNVFAGTLTRSGITFTYTPNPGYVGPDSFTVLVVDSYGAHSNIATISINVIANNPPTLSVPASATGTVGQTLAIQATAADPDLPDDTLTYSLVNPPLGATINSTTGAITFLTSVAGNYSLSVKITDISGATDTKPISVTMASEATKSAHILVTDIQAVRVNATTVTITFNFLNSGLGQANNVKITSAKLKGIATSSLPAAFTIPAGNRQSVTLTFTGSALTPGTAAFLLNGSYTGGPFSTGVNITLP